MTVIAWDGKTLAADKMMGFGTSHATVTKIHRINGDLVAWSGEAALGKACREWVRAGLIPADFPAGQRDPDRTGSLLVIKRSGAIHHYAAEPYALEVENATYSIGSGGEYADAAMYLGKTAREAVEVACALDPNCGNGIDTLTLRED